MTISVLFRGPMLFLSRENADYVNEVIIPDASSERSHHDGTLGKRHFGGVIVVENGHTAYRPLLAEAVVITAHGQNGLPEVEDSFHGLPPVDQMANPGTSRRDSITRMTDPPLASTVTLTGGRFSAENPSSVDLILTRHGANPFDPRPIPVLTRWSSEAPYGTLKIGDDPERNFGPDVQIIVYNWDEPRPKPNELTDPVLASQIPTKYEDWDFKWIYTLFNPPASATSWEAWLDGRCLPAARTTAYKCPHRDELQAAIEEVRSSPTGTCNGGKFLET